MRVLPVQRSGRPTANAARNARRAPVIEAVAAPDRAATGRALVSLGEPLFRRLGPEAFAAGAAAPYLAQAIGQMRADDGEPARAAIAAAAYERTDAMAGFCIAAPMPAARVSA